MDRERKRGQRGRTLGQGTLMQNTAEHSRTQRGRTLGQGTLTSDYNFQFKFELKMKSSHLFYAGKISIAVVVVNWALSCVL
mgnify:CR=1 FL=1